MDDFFKKLFDPDKDNNKPIEGSEPSFDFYDFKSWLKNNDKDEPKLREQVESNKKEKLREDFHKVVKSKIQRKRRSS